MKRTGTSWRGMVLDAAEAVVARQGVANLTLEAVAAEAVRVALTFKTTGHTLNTIEIATPIPR